MSSIVKQESVLHEGKEIVLFRLRNTSGAYAEVTNLGASIVSIVVPDKKGVLSNVVLCYDDLKDYITDPFYLGNTIGRFSNRIANACFTLDGLTYSLDKNDGENSNHGGFNGVNKKIFGYQADKESVTFYTESSDGEGGFPGNLKLRVTYSFSDKNELQIEYRALSDKRTPVNFTNHAYFNLSGKASSTLTNQLKINAEVYLEADNQFLPTGRILPTQGTAFDYNYYSPIQDMLSLKRDNLKGYNAYFINRNNREALGSVKDILSGRVLDVYSNMPGVLFYTGDFLSNQFVPFQGLCMEAQYYPDALNHANFKGSILEPDIEKTDLITYSFRVEE